MKILKKVTICVTTVIFVILTTVPFAAVAQTLNPDGTVTVKDPDNPNATIIITDPNGDGKITIADSTAILQFLGGYKYNTDEQTARMDVTKNGIVSEADSYFIMYLDAYGALR